MNKSLFRISLISTLTRHKLLSICVFLLLTACGASSIQLANGIGGTGITKGRVTGFGSMFVNGVKFNTDNAIFIRDGIGSKKQDDFNTGEIVTIKGTVNEGRKTGVATEVIFSDVLEGTVTATPTKNSVEILGQRVVSDGLTVLHGINKLTDLKIGNLVEVSGFNIDSKITATSIKLIDDSFTTGSRLEVEGIISDLDTDLLTFKINNLKVDYSSAAFEAISQDSLQNGDYLIINSEHNIENNLLNASKIESVSNDIDADAYYEIEGFVTGFTSSSNFKLDDSAIATNQNTIVSNGNLSDIKAGQLLIAIGTTNSAGVLVADEIHIIESDENLSIEASIESIDLANNSFKILGQMISINNFTLLSDETSEDSVSLSLNNFAIGDSIFAEVYQIDGVYMANRLSKTESIIEDSMIGQVSAFDADQQTLNLFDNNISSDSNTKYFDKTGEVIDAAKFFGALEAGITEVLIIGNATNAADTSNFLASQLSLY